MRRIIVTIKKPCGRDTHEILNDHIHSEYILELSNSRKKKVNVANVRLQRMIFVSIGHTVYSSEDNRRPEIEDSPWWATFDRAGLWLKLKQQQLFDKSLSVFYHDTQVEVAAI